VVVVLGDLLGQLKTGVLVVGRDPADHTGLLQVDKVPVGRTARQFGGVAGDVLDADGVTGGRQDVDYLPATVGVALRYPPEPLFHQAVEGVVHRFDPTSPPARAITRLSLISTGSSQHPDHVH
jgi:hypothetical protein